MAVPCNDIGSVGRNFNFANGCYKALSSFGQFFHGGDPLGGARKSITAEVHRSGARMVCLPRKLKREPRLAHDARNRGNAQILSFQYGSRSI